MYPTPSDAIPPTAADPTEAVPAEVVPARIVDSSATGARRDRRARLGPTAALAAVIVIAGSGLFFAGYALGAQTASTPGTPVTEAQAFKPFWDAYRAITQHYAGVAVPNKQVIDGAIKGMLQSLGDPFSFYMTPEEYQKSLEDIGGQFEGIGATMQARKADGSAGDCSPLGPACRLVVIQPLAGGPADLAGVKPNDVVLRVDGVTVDGSTVDDVIKKVRGPKGKAVTLTVQRGTSAPVDIAIVRDVIVQQEVTARDLARGTVGYIKLSGFSDKAAIQFADALTTDVRSGKKSIVFDLRGNGGGFVTAARKIASQFIGSGPIFWEQAAHGEPIPTEAAPGGVALDPALRVVVLVDKNTASASEIVAGALQDTKRATIVGQQTFGKGTIQEWNLLDDENGGFRLTVYRWLTPAQRWIHKVGITPDVAVPLPDPLPAGADPTLDRALQVLGATPSAGVFGATYRA